MTKQWIARLRKEAVAAYPTFNALPGTVYSRYLCLDEWLNNLTDEALMYFLLLVCEAESASPT